MTNFSGLANAQKSIKRPIQPTKAVVVDVTAEGVKVRLYGQPVADEVYYNSTVEVAQGDHVVVTPMSGTLYVSGKFIY